ncbi:sugar transferase [Planosporangium mesophilum]|uniref:Sugar transferase n=1 Tax=Planosporangium mesophilum TaxID=689768 RepID=A0A8J3T8G8_9ACTN|nr:sugar transferase [Planosporangium mesophilum]NJC81137.1 sugar transferase [Planosporangium mesophilum]GII21212.1 sugar transferase [Planosporangium mesophilum]
MRAGEPAVYRSAAKRATDLVLAVVVLVLTAPLTALAAIAIAVSLGRPVLFSQLRTGHGRRAFRLLKFKTMTDARDPLGVLLPGSARMNAVGRFLRKSSIDELPELLNVIRGEMSLVGPRPLLPRYDPWYSGRELLRFDARPGITGLAQVNGRNGATWDDRLAMDARYVAEWSYLLDLKILARTGWQALTARGVVVDPTALMADLDAERKSRS